MPVRDDRRRRLDQFRTALDENCTVEEAGRLLDARAEAARLRAAQAKYHIALRRLRAKGWGRSAPPGEPELFD
jgi:hypothetical protein